jgi:hypothetical protein
MFIQYKNHKSSKHKYFIVALVSLLQETATCFSQQIIFRKSQYKIRQGQYDKTESISFA